LAGRAGLSLAAWTIDESADEAADETTDETTDGTDTDDAADTGEATNDAANIDEATDEAPDKTAKVVGKVAGQDTFDTLVEAIDAAKAAGRLPAPLPVDADSRREAEDQRDTLVSTLNKIEETRQVLEVAHIEAYNSNQVWQLQQALIELDAEIAHGEKTLAESEGKVDDKTPREESRQVLGDAIAVLDELTAELNAMLGEPSVSPSFSPSAKPSTTP
jgi:hypothetical protein